MRKLFRFFSFVAALFIWGFIGLSLSSGFYSAFAQDALPSQPAFELESSSRHDLKNQPQKDQPHNEHLQKDQNQKDQNQKDQNQNDLIQTEAIQRNQVKGEGAQNEQPQNEQLKNQESQNKQLQNEQVQIKKGQSQIKNAEPQNNQDMAPIQTLPQSKPALTNQISPAAAELGQQLQALVTGGQEVEIEPQETFGTRALGVVNAFVRLIRTETGDYFDGIFSIPGSFTDYFAQQTDPKLSQRWQAVWSLFYRVLAVSFALGCFAFLLTIPLSRKLVQRTPVRLAGRIEVLLVWVLVNLLPACVFIGATGYLLADAAPGKFERFVVLNIVYALTLFYLVRTLAYLMLMPNAMALRLLPLQTPLAIYLVHRILLLSAIIISGYFLIEFGKIIRFPAISLTALSNIFALMVVALLIRIILQTRGRISATLRGQLSAAQNNLTVWQSLRLWLARMWHVLAIGYLTIGYAVTAFGSQDRFALMQQGTFLTALAVLGVWLFNFMTTKILEKTLRPSTIYSAGIFRPVMKILLRFIFWGAGLCLIAYAWGLDVPELLSGPWGQRVLGSALSIGATLVSCLIVYEIVHATIERRINPCDDNGQPIEANTRARTLLPMLRNAAIIVLAVIVGFVTLSEFGINIAPLLAGAGVIGVAVGFGSQTLVKDFLTGLFIIIEDTIALGDSVSIGDHTGVVDAMTLRTIRLRDNGGAVHILPYSEITKLVNMSKNFSYAVMEIRLSYTSNLQKAMEKLASIGSELRADPVYSVLILEDLQILGVDNLGDFAVLVVCKIKTKPGKQWDVKRAFLLRVKHSFDLGEIDIPVYPLSLPSPPSAVAKV